MTRKRPDVQTCGDRHERYLHCLICNPPPVENPARLQGPEVGDECIYTRRDGSTERATVTARSYVWAPGDPAYHGGARRYDWKVIAYGAGKTLCVDDKDLTPLDWIRHPVFVTDDGIVPTCDLCDGPQRVEGEDWNGETGNHYSCERTALLRYEEDRAGGFDPATAQEHGL